MNNVTYGVVTVVQAHLCKGCKKVNDLSKGFLIQRVYQNVANHRCNIAMLFVQIKPTVGGLSTTRSRNIIAEVGKAAKESWLRIITSLVPNVPPDCFIMSSILLSCVKYCVKYCVMCKVMITMVYPL